MALPSDTSARAGWLIDRLGRHLSSRLGIGLEPEADDATLTRWLVATCLVAPRADLDRVAAAFEGLTRRGLAGPALAARQPVEIEAVLVETHHPRPPETALLLVRTLAAASQDGFSLRALLTSATSLEELGGRLSRLAPGFGRAAVTRFLQPLRESWAVCADLPLEPAAVAAGVHLGLLPPDADPRYAAGVLQREAAAGEEPAPPLRDLEAALQQLGRRACLRERTSACPLAEDCPLA